MSGKKVSKGSIITVIIPVFQNELSIRPLFDRLGLVEESLFKISTKLEVIVVEDGSSDNSFGVLKQIQSQRPDTIVIRHTRNFGSISAIKTGLRFGSGSAFVILAADLQDPPELILDMAEAWKGGSKFVICERSTRDDPLVSKIFSKLFYLFLRKFIMRDYPKGGFDLSLFDAELLPSVLDSSKSTYIPVLLWWLGYEPHVIEYSRVKRLHGKSQWTFGKKVSAFLDIMFTFSFFPIRLLLASGIIITLCSFGYGSFIFVNAINQKVSVPGFATISMFLAFITGTFFLAIGILGEYVSKIFQQLNGRPDAVVREVS
jgi:glycosyltransferase involved in cell wall biosynthesis